MCAASRRGSRCWRKTLALYGEAGPKRALCAGIGTKHQIISRTDSKALASRSAQRRVQPCQFWHMTRRRRDSFVCRRRAPPLVRAVGPATVRESFGTSIECSDGYIPHPSLLTEDVVDDPAHTIPDIIRWIGQCRERQ